MINRYDRQIKLFGKTGQEKLKNSHVAVIGAGGIGSCTAESLTRLGVGKIKIFEFDTVSFDNLNRQLLYQEKDLGKKKLDCLKKELKKINSSIKIYYFNEKLTLKNIKYLEDVDLILDCTDNLKVKLMLNEISYKLKKPLIYSSAVARDVRFYFINPTNKNRPCLNCFLNKTQIKTKAIINTTAHIASNIQVNEAIKYLIDKKIETNFLIFNLENLELKKLKITKNKNCSICN